MLVNSFLAYGRMILAIAFPHNRRGHICLSQNESVFRSVFTFTTYFMVIPSAVALITSQPLKGNSTQPCNKLSYWLVFTFSQV